MEREPTTCPAGASRAPEHRVTLPEGGIDPADFDSSVALVEPRCGIRATPVIDERNLIVREREALAGTAILGPLTCARE